MTLYVLFEKNVRKSMSMSTLTLTLYEPPSPTVEISLTLVTLVSHRPLPPHLSNVNCG